jgi:hypothetical protein
MGGGENDLYLLLTGSMAMTLSLLVAAVFFWRASRTRPIPPMLAWTSRVVALAVIADVAWHAYVLATDLEALREIAGLR